MEILRFSFPTQILFGPGARRELAPRLAAQGLARPLIVTDPGVARLPLLDELRGELRRHGLDSEVFSGISGNPTRSQAIAGARSFHDHRADCIVGLGGGSALDSAKAVALLASHPGDLFDYEDGMPGALPIDRALPYFAAVPTTAGTGSEVGRSAVISDDETHLKKIIFSPRLLARVVCADPELTLDLPPFLTAATGMDALTHCAEAYLARGPHPICDGIALEGFRLAARHLARAVLEPRDLEARGGMLMASMMGGIAFQKGLGLTHSCAHALGTATGMHHGLANGVMIDFALPHNLRAVPERFRELAHAAGIAPGSGGTGSEGESLLAWLRELKEETGIPVDLAHAGVDPATLPTLADLAFADSCHRNNPCPVSRAEFAAIFAAASAGPLRRTA